MKNYVIKLENMNVHISEWGSETKPVIFCLHGLGSSSLSFIEIAEQLKSEYRVIAIDGPGHGKTTPFPDAAAYEMPNIITWLNEVIKAIGIDQFYFLSHSWGSFVALFYVTKYRETVKDMILIDGGYQTKRLWAGTMEEEMLEYKKDFDECVFDSWEEFIDAEKPVTSRWSHYLKMAVKNLGVEENGKIRWHASGETAANIIRAMHLDETEDIYAKLPKNILLLRATLPITKEELRRKTSETFRNRAGGNVQQVQDATHMLHWDHPAVVVDAIKSRWPKLDN
ncbi:alpha/beta hydrolase [Bacillus spongiae]|uniref:Alpha/beta hydrolase n=1 Tax=Bacillus spongiae TaxID=2683610 RepID=A0ABU8HCQ5_9BACI